jgi:hypothetical protein
MTDQFIISSWNPMVMPSAKLGAFQCWGPFGRCSMPGDNVPCQRLYLCTRFGSRTRLTSNFMFFIAYAFAPNIITFTNNIIIAWIRLVLPSAPLMGDGPELRSLNHRYHTSSLNWFDRRGRINNILKWICALLQHGAIEIQRCGSNRKTVHT